MSIFPVSVVIPLYNKVRYVKRALDSILAQTFTDFEVIVVDDGSTDGSGDVIRRYDDGRIRLIIQENRGCNAARNRAIAASHGGLIAFLDADDEWLPDYLETVMALRSKYPQVAVWATAYRRISREGKDISSRFGWLDSPQNSGTYIVDYFARHCRYEARIYTCSLVVNKDCILVAGGFPENIVQGGDSDTWFRLALRYKTAWCSDFKVINYMNADNHLWASGKYAYYGVRPTMASFRKFVVERGGDEGISDRVYSHVAADLRSQLEVNLLAGDGHAVRQTVRDLRSLHRWGPLDGRAYLLSFLPNRLYRGLWCLYRAVRRRSTRLREFRSVCRDG